MFKKLTLAATLALAACTAHAADISFRDMGDNFTAVSISGEIQMYDGLKFKKLIAKIPARHNVIVDLDSPGGNVIGGLGIANMVLANGYSTMVGGNTMCASMCADIWLAGKTRFVFDGAKIGMHSAGNKVGKGSKTRLVRNDNLNMLRMAFYLNRGLSIETAVAILTPNPNSMMWLDTTNAAKLNIEYKYVGDKKTDGCASTTPGGTWKC